MSLTGLAVESNQAMRIGDPYRLSVHGDGQQVEIDAEVQWSRLVRASCGRAGARYQAGLDFTRFLDDRAPDILRFLKDHVVIHVLRRLEGRLDVWDGTVLDRHCRLLVRQISVHHMYLATDSSPAPAVGQSVQVHIQDPSLYLAPDGTIAFVDRTVPREFGRGCHVMVELTDLSLVNRLLLESFVCDVLE